MVDKVPPQSIVDANEFISGEDILQAWWRDIHLGMFCNRAALVVTNDGSFKTSHTATGVVPWSYGFYVVQGIAVFTLPSHLNEILYLPNILFGIREKKKNTLYLVSLFCFFYDTQKN